MKNSLYDVIVCGGGPGGLSAAMYAGRSGLKVLLIEKMFLGGQASTTFEIENYLGFEEPISGTDFAMKSESQVKKSGAEVLFSTIKSLELDEKIKKVVTRDTIYETKNIVIAFGSTPRKLGVEHEDALRGRGISYCATCDGSFYRSKDVAVIGGGNTAAEDALYLSKLCTRVYLIHRRDKLRADKVLQSLIKKTDNITLIYDATLEKVNGDKVESIDINVNGKKRRIEVSGVFAAIGVKPQSALLEGKLDMEDGYIVTDEKMRTSVKNVYAVGDIRKKFLRQIVTAASDGAIAATAIMQEG